MKNSRWMKLSLLLVLVSFFATQVYASVVPVYEFGTLQNVTENQWPAAMRSAFKNAMPKDDDVASWFKTPAFDYSEGHHSADEDMPGNVGYITTQDEQIQWFQNLPSERMKFQLVTGYPYYSGNDASDYALENTFEHIVAVFSKPSVFTPEEVKALGKPVVWLHGSIHGGEQSPGEALLQLAKELAEGKHDDILEKITVVMVPRFNIDGAWNAQRQTTALAPVGHVGQNTAGLDMNRDFVGFEAPIVRGIRQLQIAYDPFISYCGHQMGYFWDEEFVDGEATGYRRTYEGAGLTTTMTLNLNVDKKVRDIGRDIFEPHLKNLLEEQGVGWNWYIGGAIATGDLAEGENGQTIVPREVVSSDGVTGPLQGETRYTTVRSDFHLVPEEGIGINGTAIANQSLVFVHEMPSVSLRLDYLRRVYSAYLGVSSIIRVAADNADVITEAVNAARAVEVARTEPLSFWGQTPETVDDERTVFEYTGWEKDSEVIVTKNPMRSIRGHDAQPDPNASVTRPAAYIIPKENYEAAMRLFYTGAELERLTADTALEVEAYTVLEVGDSKESPSDRGQGTAQLSTAIRRVSKATKTITFPKDSFVVRMDQLGASLVGLSLEPRAIRNYGNYYLSRTTGSGFTEQEKTNSARIPETYRDLFLPVSVGAEFPVYRYMSEEMPATYSANMNLPFMLTMVAKVHSPTQEEIADMTAKLGLSGAPEYISKFELPVLSRDGDLSYKDQFDINEAFMLPDGEVIDITDYVIDGKNVLIAAPEGLDGAVYAANSEGEFVQVAE